MSLRSHGLDTNVLGPDASLRSGGGHGLERGDRGRSLIDDGACVKRRVRRDEALRPDDSVVRYTLGRLYPANCRPAVSADWLGHRVGLKRGVWSREAVASP